MTDLTPGVPQHAAPDPTTQTTPEPLVSAEMIRALIALAVGTKWVGFQLPDPAMDVVVDIALGVVGLGLSAGLTLITRGKVWAMRRGIDVDQVVDEVQARTR
jgi:hypothetical protein